MQHRRHHAISVQQASQEAPELVQLLRLNQESQQRLRSIMALVPPGLRASVQAGPIEGSTWSVHVPAPTAAAKLRQLLPAFAAHLRSKGWDVQHIRVYVLPQNR